MWLLLLLITVIVAIAVVVYCHSVAERKKVGGLKPFGSIYRDFSSGWNAYFGIGHDFSGVYASTNVHVNKTKVDGAVSLSKKVGDGRLSAKYKVPLVDL
jgi:hypothetical protein